MSDNNKIHKLLITAKNKPEVATEGEKVLVKFFVRNTGETTFPGGEIAIRFFPAVLGDNAYVHETLVIDDSIEPNIETPIGGGEVIPMASGYTLFIIENASATDEIPVQVFEANKQLCFPRVGSKAQVFHSVRAQTHEEVSQRQAVWLAIIALFLVIAFQGIDWAIRFIFGV
jgi:hypothetical protein